MAALVAVAAPARAGTLSTPIDPAQQTALQFGDRSHWLQPWRAYLDTVPAQTLQDAVGINFNVEPGEADAAARLLSESGFQHARVEIGWSEVDFNDPERLWTDGRVHAYLTALRDHGIRPLILLNAHHGAPCPHRFFEVRLTQSAPQGARTVKVDAASVQAIVPGRTGLNATDEYKAAAILFTAVKSDGTVTLSKPLPSPLGAGDHPAATLAYQPFQHPKLADGRPNPVFEVTMAGWLDYVDIVTRRVREILGTTQFDVEVWNELSFGSDFLDASSYHDPAPDTGVGDTHREILERTVAFIRDPARGLQEVGIGDGFANQSPWQAGSTSPPGLTAIDKHPYPGLLQFPADGTEAGGRPLDALGRVSGNQTAPDEWREDPIPGYRAFFPEYYLSAIQTEHLVRDLSPITTTVYGTAHGRNTHPSGSSPPEVWLTEMGMDFSGVGLSGADAAHLRAKATLRSTTAFVNKGVTALDFYAAKGDEFGLIDPSFFDAVDRSGGAYPGGGSAGPTMAAMGRMMRRFAPAHIDSERELSLLRVADDHDQYQFAGDGTPGHPPLYNRDVLAFLPFQVADDRFVSSVYVMTRDLARVQQPNLPSSDPARLDLPAAPYRLTIGNLNGQTVRASAYDPVKDEEVPVEILSRGPNSAVIQLPVTDSPRLLVLEDSDQVSPAADPPPPPPDSTPSETATPPGAASTSPGSLELTSVRVRGDRIQVSGSVTQPTNIQLAVSFSRPGRRWVLRSRVVTGGPRFRTHLRLPRSAVPTRTIQRVKVVAQAAGVVRRTRWRV